MTHDIKLVSITLISLMLLCFAALFVVVSGLNSSFIHMVDLSDGLFAAFIAGFLFYKL